MERSFYVLAYDISDDRRRNKIAKSCEAVAERVQGSVFEGYFTPAELEKLLKRVERQMNKDEDSLRFYTLCAECRRKVGTRGQGKVTQAPSAVIV